MKSKIIFILIIIFCFLIFLKGYLFTTKYKSDEKVKEYTVFVESVKSISDTKVSYIVKLLGTSDKFILNFYDDAYDKIQTDLHEYSNYTYGDVLNIKGKISIPQKFNNPGEFDYKQYLYSINVHGLINTYENPEAVQYALDFVENIYKKIYMFKENVKNIIENNMNETNAGVAKAIIYGDVTSLEESIKEDVEQIGVSHLMSVSGTHITYFMLIINTVLGNKTYIRNGRKREKAKTNKKTKFIIQVFAICFYMIFTGFSISVVRAGIMLIISIVCDMLEKRKNKYQALGVTFGIILFHNPYVLFNSGMKLSFLATFGIILFSKHIVKFFERFSDKIKNKITKKIVYYITQNIAITIAVQLLIFPIQIQLFNKLTIPLIIPNLILGIITMPIIVIGSCGAMLAFNNLISGKIFVFLEPVINGFIYLTKILKKMSFNISIASQPIIFFILYYMLIISLFVYFKIYNVANKGEKYNLKRLLKYLKVFQIIFTAIITTFLIIFNVYVVYFSQYVYFFNVGQGDMSYIKYGRDSVIVDIGSMNNSLAYNSISNYFKMSNLNRVDAVVISHMHKDHVNGLEKLIQNYSVGSIIYAKPKNESETYNNFKELLNKYNINTREVKAGDVIKFGDIKIQVLLPDEKYIEAVDEINTNSLICKISIKDKELLYMGDASKESEEKLIQRNIDIGEIYILKVGHHGSKTATSNEFIQKIKPKNAVISALKKYYNHPHDETIATLKENNVYIYITEKQGAIKFKLD